MGTTKDTNYMETWKPGNHTQLEVRVHAKGQEPYPHAAYLVHKYAVETQQYVFTDQFPNETSLLLYLGARWTDENLLSVQNMGYQKGSLNPNSVH